MYTQVFSCAFHSEIVMNIAKKVITNDALTFLWADETTTTVRFEDFTVDMDVRAKAHGYSQKLGDSYSGAVSVTDAKERFKAVLEGLMQNDWNRKGMATGGLWVEALAKATNETLEAALKAWDNMDDAKKAATKKHPDLLKAKAEIELERVEAKFKDDEIKPLEL